MHWCGFWRERGKAVSRIYARSRFWLEPLPHGILVRFLVQLFAGVQNSFSQLNGGGLLHDILHGWNRLAEYLQCCVMSYQAV